MSKFEEALNVEEGTFARQEELLAKGKIAWVVISGKMCSGKDTLAPRLELPGGSKIISYGEILRNRLDNAMKALEKDKKLGMNEEHQIRSLRYSLSMSQENAVTLLSLLEREKQEHPNSTPWDRTNGMRNILQLMGSIWLPFKDFLPVISSKEYIMPTIDSGRSVIAAGSRFLPDVDIPKLAGALTVRLDVTRETQLRRLKSRDGLDISDDLLKALNNPGESELDDYPHDIRIDNNDDSVGKIEEIVNEVNERIKHILHERGLKNES